MKLKAATSDTNGGFLTNNVVNIAVGIENSINATIVLPSNTAIVLITFPNLVVILLNTIASRSAIVTLLIMREISIENYKLKHPCYQYFLTQRPTITSSHDFINNLFYFNVIMIRVSIFSWFIIILIQNDKR